MKIKSILCALGALGCSSVLWAQAEGWCPDNGDGTFTNPILWGDWPDPDVIRVGDDFYMVSTSMHYVPGSPILMLWNAMMKILGMICREGHFI